MTYLGLQVQVHLHMLRATERPSIGLVPDVDDVHEDISEPLADQH